MPSTPDEPTSHKDNKKSDYFEMKIPRHVFRGISFSPILIIIAIAFAFLLGMQTARIRYMEKDLARLQSIAGSQQAAAQDGDSGEPVLGQKVDMEVGSLPTIGKDNAKVTMVAFSDFQCPFCKSFYDDSFKQIKKEYVDTGKVRFAFRHLPLDIHPLAPKAAEAAECANEQDKFWDYHDMLFEQFDSWTGESEETLATKLTSFAQDLNLNSGQFSECLTSGKFAKKVNDDMTIGQTAGATGTPTFYINGQKLVGAFPFVTFKKFLDQELNK